jgi:hypothetical protein
MHGERVKIGANSLICTFWRTNKLYSYKYKLSLIIIIK